MSVLVDTSVWIRGLAGREPYAAGLDRLLSREDVTAHEFVYGELLMGAPGGRAELLENLDRLPSAPLVPHRDVAALVRHRKLQGRGIGWIDAHLLASALAGGLRLWSADAALDRVAQELQVAYR